MTAESKLPAPMDTTGWLRYGHALEAEGTVAALGEAIRAYDVVIAQLRLLPLQGRDDLRRDLGGAWMNRGNALQKQASPAALAEAVQAYDEAIAILAPLPIAISAPHRNCLGSAWMNRGHAVLQLGGAEHLASAVASHETAAALLRELPLAEIPAYRLNLAGALINLANALLPGGQPAHFTRARAIAHEAWELVADREKNASEFAELGLKARRVFCESIGQLLFAARDDTRAIERLADEASDAADSGLALARRWESRGVPHFRLLAARLFRFGAQLYRLHQPQFLAEFVLENIEDSSAPAAWRADPEFREIAATALAQAQAGLLRPEVLTIGDADSERALALHRSLADAAAILARGLQ